MQVTRVWSNLNLSEIVWCSRASNSGQIWSQFELIRGPMHVMVPCKFDESPVKMS